jgi:hypothetical protein
MRSCTGIDMSCAKIQPDDEALKLRSVTTEIRAFPWSSKDCARRQRLRHLYGPTEVLITEWCDQLGLGKAEMDV